MIKINSLLCIFGGQAKITAYTQLTSFILSLSKDGPRMNLSTNVSQSTYSKPTLTSNLSFDELRMKGFWSKISVLGVHTLILLFLSMAPLTAKQDLTKLLEKQAANPTDPIVNYNLGVAQYLDKK